MAARQTARGQTPLHTPSADDAAATPSCSDRPGRLYTYRSHGIHVCANVVCGYDGVAGAVLLRAAAVESGLDIAGNRRGDTVRPAALARGPGNLCSALGITMDDNGIDLFDARSPVQLSLASRAHRGRRAARGRQPGRRPAVAVLAGGTPGGFAVPPQSAGTGARSERLIREDRVHGNVEHPRRVGLARADCAVH